MDVLTTRVNVGTERRVLLAVVCALFVVKLAIALFVVPKFAHHLDSVYQVAHVDNYYSIAKNIDAGRGYRFTADTAPTMMREPGYPYFLAVFVHFFDNYFRAAVVANVVLSCLSALLISGLARRIWHVPWVAVVAPLLFLLHPGVFIAESRLGIEMPFIFLLLCFFTALARSLETDAVVDYAAAGLALGLTCLVRSTMLFFPIVLLLYRCYRTPGAAAMARSASRIAVMAAAGLAVLSPWIVRNYVLVHRFIPTATDAGVALQTGLYKCVNRDSGRSYEQLDTEAAEQRNLIATRAGYRFVPDYYQFFFDPQDEVKFTSALRTNTLSVYRQSPGLLATCATENVANFWFRGKDWLSTSGAVLCQLPYLILALVALLSSVRPSDRRLLDGLLLFVAYSIAICLPIQAQARYSIPVIPVLAILGALPLARLLEGLGRQARSSAEVFV